MRWPRSIAVCAVGLGMLFHPVSAIASLPTTHAVFVVPHELRARVEFWKNVFATYSQRQVVFHDTEHLDRVYSVLDFRSTEVDGEEAGGLQRYIADRVDEEEDRIRALLLRLHQSGGAEDEVTPDERRIARLFATDPSPNRFLDAAAPDRLRTQAGLKERFAAGIEIGHRYFPEMEAIFASERVPVELTRLPLIESCFNVRAYSKVGAAGIWQFMPSTGRRFMRVDALIDERRDPIESTRAAAQFLRENYEKLGAWPLALTAYNHGPAGIARAVREVGSTDIVRIINEYRGPAFKFASQNFYPEFLAALDVERNHEKHFGALTLMQPLPTHAVHLSHPIAIRSAAAYAGIDRDVLADLNPSLSPQVEDGRRSIPAGYRLRIPAGSLQRFGAQYQQYASTYREPRVTASRGKRGHKIVAARSKRSSGRTTVARGRSAQRAAQHVSSKTNRAPK